MNLFDPLVALIVGAIIIILAVAALVLIRKIRSGAEESGELLSPTIDQLFDAILPHIYKAILAGERSVIWAFDAGERYLESADKKAVAESVYALIPEIVLVGNVPVPVGVIKKLIPIELFEAWVKEVYDQADAFLTKNEDYLRSQVQSLDLTA